MSDNDADTLVVQNLSVPFGANAGLHKVSMRVARGERVVIVGASGAGKTSLLRAIAGLASISHGSISVSGRDVTQLPPEQRGAVYMHQTPLLFPHLTIFENVAFPLRVRGVANPEVGQRVHDALEQVQLQSLAARAPQTLSGGQQHRAALARAVVGRPALLLLDEPFSSLDPGLRDEVRDALVKLQESLRLSVLLITHDIEEASRLADRIGVLKDGGILQMGTPAELFEAPRSTAVAMALGRRAILDGTLNSQGEVRCALGTFVADARALAGGLLTSDQDASPQLASDQFRSPQLAPAPLASSLRSPDNTEIAVSVLLLPGALSLMPPLADGPAFPVQRISFGGDGPTAHLHVAASSLEIPVPPAVNLGAYDTMITAGTIVSLRIVPSRVRLFKR